MEIFVDDESKLTLHGLVSSAFYFSAFASLNCGRWWFLLSSVWVLLVLRPAKTPFFCCWPSFRSFSSCLSLSLPSPFPSSFLFLCAQQQHYIEVAENQKNRKLNDILDRLEFNQVVIFVKSVRRAQELNEILTQSNFPAMSIHSGLPQAERYLLCCFFVGWGLSFLRLPFTVLFSCFCFLLFHCFSPLSILFLPHLAASIYSLSLRNTRLVFL